MRIHRYLIVGVALLLASVTGYGQKVTVAEEEYLTYDYSDPDPVPHPQRIYPYYRYDGFTNSGAPRKWKVVTLENDYLRVKIFPEIGGKIWSVYDKTHGKELFYGNDVVKFRDLSLRGPWTSGGIEFNYGVVGHAPSCFTPVDYHAETKEDGSVSCYIGVSDLLTRSRWMIEINLPRDAALVSTRSFWHNSSGLFQPYYSWANSGIKVTNDLEIIYPAQYTIAHWGDISPYPVDEKGRNLSKYADQAFGADKSYHAGGSRKEYFGALWPGENFGMLHYARRDEKLGRKYFSWAQSSQGSIWIDLLTDSGIQYVEMQSGRLFNQNLSGSEKTPFKQTVFSPYGTDEWIEYWLPFSDITHVDNGNDKAVVEIGDGKVTIYPVRPLKGVLSFKSVDGKSDKEINVNRKATETFTATCNTKDLAFIKYNGSLLWSSESENIDRPSQILPGYEDTSVQGLTNNAKYLYGIKRFKEAEEKTDAALAIDPSYCDALIIKSLLAYKRASYSESYEIASRVLAVDEYDPQANYVSALSAVAMGKVTDAKDRFEVAAITYELRSAACTELARIYIKEGDKDAAIEYLKKAAVTNAYNLTVFELVYQIKPSEYVLNQISSLDPLCHFPAIEQMLEGKISADALAASIQEEMRFQNYLEYAIFYHSLGLNHKAVKLLEACPDQNALVLLWRAYLKRNPSLIPEAERSFRDFVFPFRQESLKMLEWSVENGGGPVSFYYLALLNDYLGNVDIAKKIAAKTDLNNAAFYSYRASLTGSLDDMKKAVWLDSGQWRYLQNLALYYYRNGEAEKVISHVEPFYLAHKDNFHIGDTYVKALIACGKYGRAEKVMDSMLILPFEGQAATRIMYRDIKLHLAAEKIDRRHYRAALKKLEEARLWPENLGVGKPYDDMIDTSPEDVLTAIVYDRLGKMSEAKNFLEKATAADPDGQWDVFFEEARRGNVRSLLRNQDSTLDKKLF